MNNGKKIQKALDIAFAYSQTNDVCHKTWLVDQMVRALCGNEKKYRKWVEEYEQPCNGVVYNWNKGNAPWEIKK